MHSAVSPPYNVAEYPSSPHSTGSELQNVVAYACTVLDQTPPPSVREILGAYKSRGNGDRDMLLAILNAKSAEDQRLASVATLHQRVLEVNLTLPESSQEPRINGHHHHTTSSFIQSPVQPARHIHHRTSSHSHSPPHAQAPLPLMRDAGPPILQPPRKRQRSSNSPLGPHAVAHETHSGSQHEQLPPSPYSSSGSDSAEYSPRSRTSMAIGSLLSSGPSKASNGDDSQNINGHMNSDRSRGHQNLLQPSAVAV